MEGFYAAAFAAGLLGGVHCAGMCGGISAALSASTKGPALARQLAFNAGRIGSYALAGALGGGIGAVLVSPVVLEARLALLVLANGFMAFVGLYVAGWGGGFVRAESIGMRLWRSLEPLRGRLFPIDTTGRALLAGALWGWVPCGLVYGMLVMALASGSAAKGALVMASFGAGTLPALMGAGLAATKVLAMRRHPAARRIAGVLILGMAVLGLARLPSLQQALLRGWQCVA